MQPQRITLTTTSTVVNPSVLVINTPYLYKNRYGILKSLIFMMSIVVFTLLMMYKNKFENRFFFLILINFCHTYIITLMIGCCLFSLTTASLLTKITFDFIFHFMAFILYLIAGLWIVIQDFHEESTLQIIQIVAIFTLIIAFLHLAHGVLSYRQIIS